MSRVPLAGLPAQIRGWLSDASDRSTAQRMAGTAFLIRVFSAALIYGSGILLARWMGRAEFGIYVYVLTWVVLIGDLADLGLASSAQRFIPQYTGRKAFDLLRGYIAGSRRIAIISASVIAVVGALTMSLLRPFLPGYVFIPMMAAFVALPFYCLMQVQDGIARSYNWIGVALLPLYVVRHVVMLALVATAFALGFPSTADTAITAVAVSVALTCVAQTIVLNRKLARTVEPGPKTRETKVWLRFALPIFMVESFYLLLSSTDILVLQLFRPPEDIGVYYAAAKTLALIAFVHFAVSAAVAHQFSKYDVAQDRARLAQIVADSVRWTFWASLAAATLILAAGQPLLSLFGASFVDGYPLMFVLVVGLMARASVGPAERLLNMLGQQRACATVYASAFFLNLVLCFVLIPRFGILGAACSTATALTVEAILLFIVTKRRLGFHVFIFGGR